MQRSWLLLFKVCAWSPACNNITHAIYSQLMLGYSNETSFGFSYYRKMSGSILLSLNGASHSERSRALRLWTIHWFGGRQVVYECITCWCSPLTSFYLSRLAHLSSRPLLALLRTTSPSLVLLFLFKLFFFFCNHTTYARTSDPHSRLQLYQRRYVLRNRFAKVLWSGIKAIFAVPRRLSVYGLSTVYILFKLFSLLYMFIYPQKVNESCPYIWWWQIIYD